MTSKWFSGRGRGKSSNSSVLENRFGPLKIQRGNKVTHLGVEVVKHDDGSVRLNQNKYAAELLEEHSAPEKGVHTPMTEGGAHGVETGTELDKKGASEYRGKLAKVSWLGNTREDMRYPVSVLSRVQENPTTADAAKLKRVLDYLWTYPTKEHVFRAGGSLEVVAVADAAYGGEKGGKSRTAVVVMLRDTGVLTTESSVQPTVHTSSTAAEMTAQYRAVQIALRVQAMLMELFGKQSLSQICVLQDNAAAMYRVKEGRSLPASSSARSNLDKKHAYLQEQYHVGEMRLAWIPTELMFADALTKPMTRRNHETHFAGISDPGRLDPELTKLMGPAVPRGCVPGSVLELQDEPW